MSADKVLWVCALVCMLISATGIKTGRIKMFDLSLAFIIMTFVI